MGFLGKDYIDGVKEEYEGEEEILIDDNPVLNFYEEDDFDEDDEFNIVEAIDADVVDEEEEESDSEYMQEYESDSDEFEDDALEQEGEEPQAQVEEPANNDTNEPNESNRE